MIIGNTNKEVRDARELERRTTRGEGGPVDQRVGPPSEGVGADLLHPGPDPPAMNSDAGRNDSVLWSYSCSQEDCSEDDDGAEDEGESGVGVLYCCGKRLFWQLVKDSDLLEAFCPRCETSYAMDAGEGVEAPDEIAALKQVVMEAIAEAVSMLEQPRGPTGSAS